MRSPRLRERPSTYFAVIPVRDVKRLVEPKASVKRPSRRSKTDHRTDDRK